MLRGPTVWPEPGRHENAPRVTLRANTRQVDGSRPGISVALSHSRGRRPFQRRRGRRRERRLAGKVPSPLGDAADPTAGPPRAADRPSPGYAYPLTRGDSPEAPPLPKLEGAQRRARAAQPPPPRPPTSAASNTESEEASRRSSRTGRLLQPPARRYLVVLVVVAAAAAQAPAVLARARRVVGAPAPPCRSKCPRRRLVARAAATVLQQVPAHHGDLTERAVRVCAVRPAASAAVRGGDRQQDEHRRSPIRETARRSRPTGRGPRQRDPRRAGTRRQGDRVVKVEGRARDEDERHDHGQRAEPPRMEHEHAAQHFAVDAHVAHRQQAKED